MAKRYKVWWNNFQSSKSLFTTFAHCNTVWLYERAMICIVLLQSVRWRKACRVSERLSRAVDSGMRSSTKWSVFLSYHYTLSIVITNWWTLSSLELSEWIKSAQITTDRNTSLITDYAYLRKIYCVQIVHLQILVLIFEYLTTSYVCTDLDLTPVTVEQNKEIDTLKSNQVQINKSIECLKSWEEEKCSVCFLNVLCIQYEKVHSFCFPWII